MSIAKIEVCTETVDVGEAESKIILEAATVFGIDRLREEEVVAQIYHIGKHVIMGVYYSGVEVSRKFTGLISEIEAIKEILGYLKVGIAI